MSPILKCRNFIVIVKNQRKLTVLLTVIFLKILRPNKNKIIEHGLRETKYSFDLSIIKLLWMVVLSQQHNK